MASLKKIKRRAIIANNIKQVNADDESLLNVEISVITKNGRIPRNDDNY